MKPTLNIGKLSIGWKGPSWYWAKRGWFLSIYHPPADRVIAETTRVTILGLELRWWGRTHE